MKLFRRRQKVVVYQAADGWRWHRVSPWNGKIVGESGESYTRRYDAKRAAIRENPDATVEVAS